MHSKFKIEDLKIYLNNITILPLFCSSLVLLSRETIHPACLGHSCGAGNSTTEGLDLLAGGIGNRCKNMESNLKRKHKYEIMTEHEINKQEIAAL